MMVHLLILLSSLSMAQDLSTFNLVSWRTQNDGSVYLIPIHQRSAAYTLNGEDGGRGPASALSPQTSPLPYSHTTPGLGKFSCLKKGFQNSGLKEASSKFIAAIAIKTKERHDASLMPQNKKDEVSLKEAIQTLSAIGYCKDTEYNFKSSDIYWSESWINSPHSAVDNAAFKRIFGIETNRIDQVIENNGSFDKIKRNWDFWAKNTPSHNCSKTLAHKSVQVCRTLARACDVPGDMCEDPIIKKSISHSQIKFESEPQVSTALNEVEPTAPVKPASVQHDNTKAGHGPDNRGHHGLGPI